MEANVAPCAKRNGKPAIEDPHVREQLVDLITEARGNGYMSARTKVPALATDWPDAVSMSGKLRATEEESRAMRDDLRRARLLADEDHLTGLPNRRAFENRLKQAAASPYSNLGTTSVCNMASFLSLVKD